MFLQTWDLGPDVKKRVFPNENWIVEPWTCNKNTLDHFYVHYNNKFCQFFLNKQTDFHFLLGSYLTVWIQVAKHKAANRTLSTDFFFFLMEWYIVSQECLYTGLNNQRVMFFVKLGIGVTWWQNNKLIPNQERNTPRLYIVTLLI